MNGEVLREINQNSTQTYSILYIYMLPTVNSNNGTSYLANTTCQIIRGGFSELYCTIYRNMLYYKPQIMVADKTTSSSVKVLSKDSLVRLCSVTSYST